MSQCAEVEVGKIHTFRLTANHEGFVKVYGRCT